MLNYTKQRVLSLALWEQVKYGLDIGLDVSRDFICPKCWNEDIYSKVAVVFDEFVCPTHHNMTTALPEYVIETSPKYHGQYESKLIERLKMNKLVIHPNQSPLTVQQGELTRMRGIVRSALMGIGQDLGKLTEDIIELVAHGALVHGLNPTTGEIFPYIEKKSNGEIKKISLGINYKGLERSARRQSHFNTPRSEMRYLSAEEIKARRLHIVPNWEYFTDKKKPPTIEFDPKDCIAVEMPLYRLDVYEKLLNLAERAKSLGLKAIPVSEQAVGLGIWRPGDSIPAGRTAEWRAELRALKDAINKAYDLDFALTSMYVDRADEFVDQQTPIVVEVPEGEETHYTVDEILAENELPTQNVLPGSLLTDKKQKGLITLLKEQGITNPERLIQEVFGADYGFGDMTNISAWNLTELAKRNKLLAEQKVLPKYEGLTVDATIAALKQECLEKSIAGQKMEEA